MPDIYILSEFGKLGKRDESLIFYTPEGTSKILYPFKIKQLVLIGKVSISGEALRLLSRHKIPVSFISSNGMFNSKLTYTTEKNVILRQKQYRLLDNKKESLKIAKTIVCGKIRNQLSFMQRIKRKNAFEGNEICISIAKIKKLLKNAEKACNIDALRGFEGAATKCYFSVLKYNIHPEWATFHRRRSERHFINPTRITKDNKLI